jgi:hypothetical protein
LQLWTRPGAVGGEEVGDEEGIRAMSFLNFSYTANEYSVDPVPDSTLLLSYMNACAIQEKRSLVECLKNM